MTQSVNGKTESMLKSDEKPVRKKLPQTDVPQCSLEEALRIPRTIVENYASEPATPFDVAKAMKMQPSSGQFRMLCGAAIAYGLTQGGPNASEISLTPLGMRINRPLEEGDNLNARREALLQPRVIGEFLQKYNGHPLPKEDIALNVLESMGVPHDRAKDVLDLVLEGASTVGFVDEIKSKQYINLSSTETASIHYENGSGLLVGDSNPSDVEKGTRLIESASNNQSGAKPDGNNRKVFVTHGKNKSFIELIKKLLTFGELEAVVAEERQTVSQPVPDKVMNDMRGCGAAIIHVDDEQRLIDKDGNEHVILNQNVLIEVGAAMALYGRRFILLVKEGVKLPSNLQGLFEVRYSGDNLDGDTTMRLLDSINNIKKHPLPSFEDRG